MEPFAGKAKLVGPAVTNGGGVEWLQQFLGNCTGCTIDAVAMHWYDTATVSCSLQISELPGWYIFIRTGVISRDTLRTPALLSLATLSGSLNLPARAPQNSSNRSWNTFYRGWKHRVSLSAMRVSVSPYVYEKVLELNSSTSGDFSGNYVNDDGSLTALGTTYASTVQPPSGWNSSCTSNS